MQPKADDVADELRREVRKFWDKGRRQAREVSSLVIFERAGVDYSLHVRDLCTAGWEIGAGTQENREDAIHEIVVLNCGLQRRTQPGASWCLGRGLPPDWTYRDLEGHR